MIYFGFAVADSMFPKNARLRRAPITPEQVRKMAYQLVPCINKSHEPTIAAMRERFGIDVAVPETPPQISLQSGDSIIVMSVRGLPRLDGRHEYTADEIKKAAFEFGIWTLED